MKQKIQKKINLHVDSEKLQKRSPDGLKNNMVGESPNGPIMQSQKHEKNSFKKIKQSKFETSKESNEKASVFEIFVGRLPFDATEKQLSDFFSQCGKIVGVKILFHKDGKSKGRGFVKFANQQSVDKAVLLNDSSFQKQKIKVDTVKQFDDLFKDKQEKNLAKSKEYVPPEQKYDGIESSTLLIRNLDYCVTSDMLANLFKNSKGYLGTRLILNQAGRNRGFGFIEFIDIESAKAAFCLKDSILGSKKIYIEFSAPKNLRKSLEQGQQMIESSTQLQKEFKGDIVDL